MGHRLRRPPFAGRLPQRGIDRAQRGRREPVGIVGKALLDEGVTGHRGHSGFREHPRRVEPRRGARPPEGWSAARPRRPTTAGLPASSARRRPCASSDRPRRASAMTRRAPGSAEGSSDVHASHHPRRAPAGTTTGGQLLAQLGQHGSGSGATTAGPRLNSRPGHRGDRRGRLCHGDRPGRFDLGRLAVELAHDPSLVLVDVGLPDVRLHAVIRTRLGDDRSRTSASGNVSFTRTSIMDSGAPRVAGRGGPGEVEIARAEPLEVERHVAVPGPPDGGHDLVAALHRAARSSPASSRRARSP